MSLRAALTRTASPVSAFTSAERHPTRWWTTLQVVVALIWVLSLTFWYFYQYVELLNLDSTYYDIVGNASTVLRNINRLWLIAFFPALAFGIGWLAFSTVFAERQRREPFGRRQVPWPVSALGCLSVAICLNLLVWRLTPIPIMCGLGRYTRLVLTDEKYSGGFVESSATLMFGRLLFAGVVGSAVVLLLAWNVMRRRGARVELLGFGALALVLGLSVPVLNLYRQMPLPVPVALLEVPERSEALRTLFDEGNTDSPRSRALVRRFLETHDGQGRVVSLGEIQDWHRSWSVEACGTCLLPITALATLEGVVLDIGSGKPVSDDPRVTVEVPLSGEEIRIYDPDRPGSYRTILPSEIGAETLDDWLILKLDASLEAALVVDLLETLRRIDVERVSLAAYPFGYARAPSDAPSLIVGTRQGLQTFEPDDRFQRRAVFVRRYVPPDDGQRRCGGSDWRELRWESYWPVPEPETLSTEVQIRADAHDRYQALLVRLDRVVAGGATKIYLGLTDE